jgi:hypothetical protein
MMANLAVNFDNDYSCVSVADGLSCGFNTLLPLVNPVHNYTSARWQRENYSLR